jgi:hypothetical protein
MNETTNIDLTDAVPEAPPVNVPMTVAAVEDLMRWRADPMRKTGDSFVYFSSAASLSRIRSRDIATDRVGSAVMSMYESGRCVPVCQCNGAGSIYSVQAVDNEPVRPKL